MAVARTEARGAVPAPPLLPRAKSRRALRHDLRTAVTAYATDRGTLASLIHEIERVAKYCHGCPKASLGKAKKRVRELVEAEAPYMLDKTGLPEWKWCALYDAVQADRNDLMHTGTAAALTGTRSVALAIVLMEALMKPSKSTTVGQLMVSNPVCAQAWQTLADVRRTMLMHDYSTLPLEDGNCRNNDGWKVLRAGSLGEYLLEDRDDRLGERIRDSKLPRELVPKVTSSTLIKDVTDLPVIVADGNGLLGIVTAFDLL